MLSKTQLIDRAPILWFLLGLLFFSGGLYLGFEFVMSFWYMIIGAFSCAFGAALLLYRLREKPKSTRDTRLSPNFISSNSYPTSTLHGDASAATPEKSDESRPAPSRDSGAEQLA